eukprot:GAHX01000344.1.p1 GENE.GAHX01000344.1~~GAHX01000344.1.p1  ORF type:complete len:300 (-),score=59.00 GAHX01000344.1:49-948(-)
MDNTERIKSCLNIVRRVSPENPDSNIKALISIAPDMEDELLQRIDKPLETGTDEIGNPYVKCEYNRDGQSHRSPYTNKYSPPIEDSDFYPSDKLRALEKDMNSLLKVYKEYYYGGDAISSAYAWDLEEKSFACALVIKNLIKEKRVMKDLHVESDFPTSGIWNSINVVSVTKESDTKYNYRCFCTVYITMDTDLNVENNTHKKEKFKVNGYNTLERTSSMSVDKNKPQRDHIVNIGQLMEAVESEIRSSSLDIFINRMQSTTMDFLQSPVDRKARDVLAILHKDAEKAGKDRLEKSKKY